jgi:predicted transcriptional regulator
MSVNNAAALIQYLLDEKLVSTFFNKKYQEQMVEITPKGITVCEMLSQLKTTSEAAKKTNDLMKKKENEKDF